MESIPELIVKVSPYYASRAKKAAAGILSGVPETEHTMVYDSPSETLEPVYFFILDLIRDFGFQPEKLVDNFSSSPGSGHFGELGTRMTAMQQQGAKVMGDINTVLRSVLNIVYDLKEFRTRLEHYEALKSGNSSNKEAAILSLKQIWMDKVDITKGNSAIKAMALGQAGFQTLIDAFLAAKDIKEVDKLDLNERVKRILKPRMQEFYVWLNQSERELKKRYELEKTYLKSQVNSLKLYTRWVRPYLKAAADLERKDSGRSPDLVNAFNSIVLELDWLAKKKLDVAEAAIAGSAPRDFKKLKVKRNYYTCVLIHFKFRGIPQRFGQGGASSYVFGGRVEVTFSAYSLNEDELDALNAELDNSDLATALGFTEGATGESLEQLQDDINDFLDENKKDEEKKKDGSNPFIALIGGYSKNSQAKKEKKKEGKKKVSGPVRKDSFIEKEHFRKITAQTAAGLAFDWFDIYKKAHGMASWT